MVMEKYSTFYTVRFSVEVAGKLPITAGLYTFEYACLSN